MECSKNDFCIRHDVTNDIRTWNKVACQVEIFLSKQIQLALLRMDVITVKLHSELMCILLCLTRLLIN